MTNAGTISGPFGVRLQAGGNVTNKTGGSINGWSAAATFEGEFSNVTRSCAGKGVVRYAW